MKFAIGITSLFCIFISICYASNNVYQYTDAQGNLVISNKPPMATQNKRRQILQEELTREKAALAEAQNLLAQNANTKGNQPRITTIEDAIKEHKKNIDILNKQLGYMPK